MVDAKPQTDRWCRILPRPSERTSRHCYRSRTIGRAVDCSHPWYCLHPMPSHVASPGIDWTWKWTEKEPRGELLLLMMLMWWWRRWWLLLLRRKRQEWNRMDATSSIAVGRWVEASCGHTAVAIPSEESRRSSNEAVVVVRCCRYCSRIPMLLRWRQHWPPHPLLTPRPWK